MTTLELLKIQIELVIELSGMQGPGATLLRSALKAVEDEQRWIPVDERLPYDFTEVSISAIVSNKYKVSSGWLETRNGNQRVWCLSWGRSQATGGSVTHWRPLPEGPKSELKD